MQAGGHRAHRLLSKLRGQPGAAHHPPQVSPRQATQSPQLRQPLRIITGKFKGRKLFAVEGLTTRPTTAYNRALIFNVHNHFEGARVLDLFAGTGSYGLEALSRGASWVDFVEFSSAAISVLLKNINLVGVQDGCHVWRKRAETFLKKAEPAWDIIFLDPPYDKNLVNPCLELIFERGLLAPGGVAIAEHSSREGIAESLAPKILKHKAGKTGSFTLLGSAPGD